MEFLKIYNFQCTWIVLVCFLIFSCKQESTEVILTKEELVELELDRRIKMMRSQRLRQCRKEAYEQAAKLADSTLIARARAERTKLGDRPSTPIKPILSDTLSTKDSMELKPLIE